MPTAMPLQTDYMSNHLPLKLKGAVKTVDDPATFEQNEYPATRENINPDPYWDFGMMMPSMRKEQIKVPSYNCPRMVSSVPPPNYGTVETGKIYRSSYPAEENLNFLLGLNLKSVLTLVEGPHDDTYISWIHDNFKKHYTVPLPANKDGVKIEMKAMAKIMDILTNEKNYPILVHCNKGKHRTGCTIGAYRKLNKVSTPEIIDEYQTYAAQKARANDKKYLENLEVSVLRTWMRHDSLNANFISVITDPVTGRPIWPIFGSEDDVRFRTGHVIPSKRPLSASPQKAKKSLRMLS